MINTNKVLNCPMEFICDKQWYELMATDRLNIKFCFSCKKTVHFCKTESDLEVALEKGLCIAYETEFKASSFALKRMTLGLPRGYKGFNSLRGGNDKAD